MNRKLVVSILAILLAVAMILSLIISVIPRSAYAEGTQAEQTACDVLTEVYTGSNL